MKRRRRASKAIQIYWPLVHVDSLVLLLPYFPWLLFDAQGSVQWMGSCMWLEGMMDPATWLRWSTTILPLTNGRCCQPTWARGGATQVSVPHPTPPHARGTGGKLADLELRASSRIGHSFVLCSLQILIISTCFPNKPECILGSLFFFFLFFPLLCICNQTYPWAQQRRSGPMSQCFYGSLLDQYLPWVGRHWISHCCAEIFT